MNKNVNRHFLQENKQMAKRHKRKCSPSLVFRNTPIKIIMGYCYTPTRVAEIKGPATPNAGSELEGAGTLPRGW